MYLLGGSTVTKFAVARCRSESCTRVIECDGFEEGLLRANATLAFTHEVLNDWSQQTLSGVKWYTYLLRLLARCTTLSVEEKRQRLNRDYKAFQQSTFDYIALQNIPEDGEACNCGGKRIVGESFCVHSTFDCKSLI